MTTEAVAMFSTKEQMMGYPDVRTLNSNFGAVDKIAFRHGHGGLPIVAIANGRGSCELSLYGGHVISYRPVGHLPVLFMSKKSWFEQGRPIRGGIPVCWPWFGAHPEKADMPLHGFARISPWRMTGSEYSAQRVEVRLALGESAGSLALWPHRFALELRVSLTDSLRVELTAENRGDEPFTFTEALHSYFLVRQVMDVAVCGLEGAEYLDKVNGATRRVRQEGSVLVRQETDRVYADTEAECVINDAALGRRIVVRKEGSRSTVVWNPWVDKARRMPDFGDDEYERMICVETANAATNPVTLAPGCKHTLAVTIAVQAC